MSYVLNYNICLSRTNCRYDSGWGRRSIPMNGEARERKKRNQIQKVWIYRKRRRMRHWFSWINLDVIPDCLYDRECFFLPSQGLNLLLLAPDAFQDCLSFISFASPRMCFRRLTFKESTLEGWSLCDVLSPYSIELDTNSEKESRRWRGEERGMFFREVLRLKGTDKFVFLHQGMSRTLS